MKNGIFISYRRGESRGQARSIYQRLCHTFGAGRVFMDVDSIEKGTDFRKALADSISQSSVMLVLIGEGWSSARAHDGGRRLDDPADYVRREVAEALRAGTIVIPVRIDSASMPRAGELPEDIRELVARQSASVRHDNFSLDMAALEAAVRAHVKFRRRRLWLLIPVIAVSALLVAGIYRFVGGSNVPASATNKQQAALPRPPACQFDKMWVTPNAEPLVNRYASWLKSLKGRLHYSWQGGVAAERPGLPNGAKVIDVLALGDSLSLHYDWQRGKLQLVPIQLYLSASVVFFAGHWEQDNGRGCVLMMFPLDHGDSLARQTMIDGVWSNKSSWDSPIEFLNSGSSSSLSITPN